MSIRGIDISSNNGTVNLRAVKADGFDVVFVKATEGDTYVNPLYAQHYNLARELGMERSALHFFRPAVNPVAQALHFLRTVKGIGLAPDDLVLSVDVEVSDGLSPVEILHNLSVFIDTLIKNGERTVTLYFSPSFWSALGDPSSSYWSQFYLWSARWGHSVGSYGRAWATKGWTFWQYSDAGDLPGAGPSALDEDLFFGTAADLEKIRRVVPRQVPAKPAPWWTHMYTQLVKGGFGPRSARQVIAAVAVARQHTP